MWECPKCGRLFARQGQDHYCGSAPKTVDDYIAAQDESRRGDLCRVRDALRRALPQAQERISWSMPTYWDGRNIVHFAAFKGHIGLYPGAQAVEHFAPRLQQAGYAADKGTVRIPYGRVDVALVADVAAWCWEAGTSPRG